MKKTIFILLLLIACSAPTMQTPSLKPINENPPSGYMTTADGQTIAYQIYTSKPGSPGIILLHMLRKTRADWDSFAQYLQKNGFSVIAIDLRGHGQSTGNWEAFTTEDFQKITLDVAAAKSVLESKQADVKRLAVIGASIGANSALNYAVNDADVQTVVLLSPGLEYKGVNTEGTVNLFQKPLLIVASKDDKYSADSSEVLAGKNKNAKLVLYDTAGHGTSMFVQKELAPTILSWLKEKI